MMTGHSAIGARVTHRTPRDFFLVNTTHQVTRIQGLLAGGAMVLGIIAWGVLFVLLAG